MSKFSLVRIFLLVSIAAVSGCAGTSANNFLPSAGIADVGSAAKTIVVTSKSDSGKGSLRAAVAAANAGSTISFKLSKHAVIMLTSGPIALTKSLKIVGPGAKILSISAGRRSQIFTVAKRVRATVSGLGLTLGSAAQGGAIYNAGLLTLDNDAFSKNSSIVANGNAAPAARARRFNPKPPRRNARAPKAPPAPRIPGPDVGGSGQGGAIYNAAGASLQVANSSFNANAAPYGGAIYDDGASLTVMECSFLRNIAGGTGPATFGLGGAIAQYAGSASFAKNSFTSNVAGGGSQGSWGVGGAVYTTAGKLSLQTNTFSSNLAGGDAYGYGGAVYADQGFKGSKNTFSKNSAFGSGADGYAYGGAVYTGGALTLVGDVFSSNVSSGGGSTVYGYAFGGALDSESTATLSSVSFLNNSVLGGAGGSAQGGGVYLGGGSSNWIAVTFTGNTATASGASSYAAGGAVVAFAPLAISGATAFSSNAANAAASAAIGGLGGALAVEVGPFSFTGSALTNSATTAGGALWIDDTANVANSLISGNTVTSAQNALDGGGGLYVALGGVFTMTSSTLVGNATSGATPQTGGGGLFNAGSSTVTNSTITGNMSSVDGGGIENETAGTFVLTNVTIYQNVAAGLGGSLKNLFPDSKMSVTNSILAGGSASGQPDDISNDGTIVSGDYNIVQTAPLGNTIGGSTGHNIAADPLLSALSNNGGPTPTNADGSSSPGTAHVPYNSCLAANITVDQRGYSRDATNNGLCDVGAFEDQTPP